jgi:hypothetical protein
MTTKQPVLPVYDFSTANIKFKSGGNFDVLKQLFPQD